MKSNAKKNLRITTTQSLIRFLPILRFCEPFLLLGELFFPRYEEYDIGTHLNYFICLSSFQSYIYCMLLFENWIFYSCCEIQHYSSILEDDMSSILPFCILELLWSFSIISKDYYRGLCCITYWDYLYNMLANNVPYTVR